MSLNTITSKLRIRLFVIPAIIAFSGLQLSSGAVTALISIVDSTSLEVELFGSLAPPDPRRFGGTISVSFGTQRITNNILPDSILDRGLSVHTTFPNFGTFINNANTSSDLLILVNASRGLSTSTDFSSGATFIYPIPHQIEIGDPFDVFWGTDLTGEDAGTFQSSGVVIPEPHSLALLLGSVFIILFTRSRDWLTT